MLFATDPLSLIFLGFFLFGALYMLLLFLAGNSSIHGITHTGGHTGIGHHGMQHGVVMRLRPTLLLLGIFSLLFGLIGYIFHNELHWHAQVAVLIAIPIGAFLSYMIIGVMNRMFGGQEISSIQDIADVSGMLARVNITIPASGLGEIVYTSPGGMRKSIAARSIYNTAIPVGKEVVVQSEKDGVAEVGTWQEIIEQKHDSILQEGS